MLLALLLSQLMPGSPTGPLFASRKRAPALAFFEAFPANGAGTTTACSITPPTGAKGEVLSFSRSTTATCQRTAAGGLATTGIANGDLVTLSANVARVEYDSAGVLGLRVESARTNSVLQSEEFGSVVWIKDANVTLTTDYAVGPFGATTAERAQFTATSAGQRSIIYAAVNPCPVGGSGTQSLYVRGTSGSGAMDLCAGDITQCASCAYVSTSWTRCTNAMATSGAPGYYVLGNATVWSGVARAANDVLILGAQCEARAYASSYIPTTTVALTRATELPLFPNVAMTTSGSVAVTGTPLWTGASVGCCTGLVGNNSGAADFLYTKNNVITYWEGTNNPTHAALWVAGSSLRAASSWSGSAGALFNVTAATSVATLFDGTFPSNNLGIGVSAQLGVGPFDGIVSRVCADPSAARCR